MSVINPGWLQNGETNAVQLRLYKTALLGSKNLGDNNLSAGGGVGRQFGSFGSFDVAESSPAAMSVDVDAGVAVIPGSGNNQSSYFVVNDAAVTVTLDTADPTKARTDLIVATIQDGFYEGSVNGTTLQAITGTPANSPQDPDIPDNSIVLAAISVGAGVSSITDVEIFDRRSFIHCIGGVRTVRTKNDIVAGEIKDGQLLYESTNKHWLAYNGNDHVSFAGQGYQYLTTVYYTSDGTFVKADYPNLRAIRVICVGGGGGGGGAAATSSGNSAVAGGGGGGSYVESFVLESDLNASETVTIGTGGAGGVAGNNTGSNGTQTMFTTIPLTIDAENGGGGQGGSDQLVEQVNFGGTGGGFFSAGGFILPGSQGGQGVIINGRRAMTGWGAGNKLAGVSRVSGTDAGGNGNAGKLYGGGGSGGHNPQATGTARSGGDGADGICIVQVYV